MFNLRSNIPNKYATCMFDISLPFLSFQPQSVAWEFWNAFATQVLFTFNNYVNQFMIYIHTRFIVRSSIIKESVTHESTKSLEVQGYTKYRYVTFILSCWLQLNALSRYVSLLLARSQNQDQWMSLFGFSPPSVHQSQPQHQLCQNPAFSSWHPANINNQLCKTMVNIDPNSISVMTIMFVCNEYCEHLLQTGGQHPTRFRWSPRQSTESKTSIQIDKR